MAASEPEEKETTMTTCQMPILDDRRALLFSIDGEAAPVYQVQSGSWAKEEYRFQEANLPQEIRDKMSALEQSGEPGAFARILQGEVGVYLICESNIKNLPEPAAPEISFDPFAQQGNAQVLSPYDIIIRAKAGTVWDEDGSTRQTQEGDYYVIPCQTWGRMILAQNGEPEHVEITRKMLALLEELNGKNFLAMSPDKPEEVLPPDMPTPDVACFGVTCAVLNLSHFKR